MSREDQNTETQNTDTKASRATKLMLAFGSSGISGIVAGIILQAIDSAGVVGMDLALAYLIIAWLVLTFWAAAATCIYYQSRNHTVAVTIFALIIIGFPLAVLYNWIDSRRLDQEKQKIAEQR